MSERRLVRSAGTLVTALVVGILFSAAAQAAPGDLDLTFSGDGKQRTEVGSASSRAEAVARQPDGKIVAVGTVAGYGANDFALARYNSNGTLDTSFSGDGRQTTDFGPSDSAYGVAIRGDGKIVVVGSTGAGAREDFALARYNPNGSLDPSFSGDGKQTTDIDAGDSARGVALQGDGKIVAAGFNGAPNGGAFALARYNPNGSLDTSFSGDGRQTTNFGNGALANDVAIQGDGKIVAVGLAGATFAQDFALARYNSNGSLDTNFSGDGRQTTDFGGDTEGARGVAIQGDGKIVAVGFSFPDVDFALARYNPNGTLDTSFSGDGRQTTDFGDLAQAEAVAIQGDGKIIAVGFAGAGSAGDFALARYNPNGTLDPSFSGDGRERTGFGLVVNGVTLQNDGKIVAVGPATGGAFGLARYHPDGSLDAGFSGDGTQTTRFGVVDQANGVALQSDGKIIAVGGSGVTRPSDFGVARYNPDGSLDSSFSSDGRQTTPFGPFNDQAFGVALQGDGKIIAVGEAGGNFGLARYNPDGSLDSSFNLNGRQTTDFGGFDRATGVAVQGDGKIVAVGFAAGGDFALARYNPNGSLDTSFSGDGKQKTDFGGPDVAAGVALQGDGKIVVVGQGTGGGNFALARYNPNGSLDASFSVDGKQTTDFVFGATDGARGLVLQGDGKIVAAGLSSGGSSDFALARYNPNGTLDSSFSGDGKQTTDFGGSSDVANGVALQADGKIVAAGVGLGTSYTSDFALARYLGD
jgi:uncharacterized delta-60 repeat protein